MRTTIVGVPGVDAASIDRPLLSGRPSLSLDELVVLAAFLCFVFWDAYVPAIGLRPLDVAGIGILAVGLIGFAVPRPAGMVGVPEIALCIVVCVAAVVGVAVDQVNVRAAIGTVLGVGVFLTFCTWPLSRGGVLAAIDFALILNLLGFWIQFCVYHTAGKVVNFHSLLGAEPRVFAPFFRGAGLYLEPAHFSLMSISLLSLRIHLGKWGDTIFWTTVVTILCSLSLWGAVAVVCLLTVRAIKTPRGWMIAACVICAVSVGMLVTGIWKEIYVLDRMTRLAMDPSANERFGALADLSLTSLWTFDFWFGRGVSVDYMTLGASSFSYLFTSVGAVGTAGFIVAMLVRGQRGHRLQMAAVLLLMLTAAYLWTFMYWWSWLALFGRRDLQEK